jgi:thiamine-phosphate pyrophosphorylase
MTTWDVYLVTQASLSEGRSTEAVVDAAIDGGVDVVQLREKNASARERYHLGRKLRELTDEANVPLIVNDRVDIAMAVDADGVHLGDEDLPTSAARSLLGEDAIIGRSVSNVEAAREAEAKGVDYLGVGAIYATDSKADIDDDEYAIGLDRLREITEAVEIPVVAIGGIDVENATDAIAAGADGVAVISAITAADDPQGATRELKHAVAAGR